MKLIYFLYSIFSILFLFLYSIFYTLCSGCRSDTRLQPGNYKFPFQFPLPSHNLPTSFVHEVGDVSYWLNAVVDSPGLRSKLQAHNSLFIVGQVGITNPKALVSIERLFLFNYQCTAA